MPQLLIAWLRNLGDQDISSNEILRKITAWNICQYQASWMDNLVSSFKHATGTLKSAGMFWNFASWNRFSDLFYHFNDKHTVSILYWGHNNVNRLPNNTSQNCPSKLWLIRDSCDPCIPTVRDEFRCRPRSQLSRYNFSGSQLLLYFGALCSVRSS